MQNTQECLVLGAGATGKATRGAPFQKMGKCAGGSFCRQRRGGLRGHRAGRGG